MEVMGNLIATDAKSTVIGYGDNLSMPEYIMDRVLYMHRTTIGFPQLPPVYQDYLIPVRQMLSNARPSELPIYVTIDEKALQPGQHHRRPGIHVDFNWYEKTVSHGEDPEWVAHPERYNDDGTNHRPPTRKREPGKHGNAGTHNGAHGHRLADNPKGGMLLATNHMSSWAYDGTFSGDIMPGGDCSLIDLKRNFLAAVPLAENQTYFLGALCIHEPFPVQFAVKRQLIRINFHPEYDINK